MQSSWYQNNVILSLLYFATPAVIDPAWTKPFRPDKSGLLELFKLTVKSLNPKAIFDDISKGRCTVSFHGPASRSRSTQQAIFLKMAVEFDFCRFVVL